MKTLGLIGGLSWESTALYYSLLNEGVRDRLGALHSARVIMWSFDFDPIARYQERGQWDALGDEMVRAARRLESAGADALLLCSNTVHVAADRVEAAVRIPLLHIADATVAAIGKCGVARPALLATRYTIEQEFYSGRLRERHRVQLIVPPPASRAALNRIIYQELCRGIINPRSKLECLGMVEELIKAGADGVILGCTELGLLVTAGDLAVPLFDSTRIHVEQALEFALNQPAESAH